MSLVVASNVREIIDTDLTDAEIDTFIATADTLINQVYATDTITTLELKTTIEKWLTAHFIAISRERQLNEISIGGAVDVKYQGVTTSGLSATLYGQNALLLDVTGRLKNLGKGQAKLFAIKTFYNADLGRR